jgi:hypothetical protein
MRTRIKVKVNIKSHFTTKPKAQLEKHNKVPLSTSGGDVQMDKSEDDLLGSDFDIYGDLK